MIAVLLLGLVGVGFWVLWCSGDNRRYYKAMGWTHRWIVGRQENNDE